MRVFFKILVGVMAIVLINGCTVKDKKVADNTPQKPVEKRTFERVKIPVLLTDPNDRAAYYIVHYWDNFDFRDTMLCHLPDISEQAFADFLDLFQYTEYNKMSIAVKKLMDSAEVDIVMYNYFYHLAERYLYDPNSPARNDEYFIPFLEQIIASVKVMDEYKIRPMQQLQLAYRNRPGAKAADVVYTTITGKSDRLYNISATYVLLMFFNPDCNECRQTTAQLRSSPLISSAVASGKMKVLAVYPDENLDAWRNHLNDIPTTWINGYDQSLAIRNNQTYDLKAIPTLYLLDEKKQVILKDTYAEAIHNYLTNNL